MQGQNMMVGRIRGCESRDEGLGMEKGVLGYQGQEDGMTETQGWRMCDGLCRTLTIPCPCPLLFLMSHSKEINTSAVTVTQGKVGRHKTERE